MDLILTGGPRDGQMLSVPDKVKYLQIPEYTTFGDLVCLTYDGMTGEFMREGIPQSQMRDHPMVGEEREPEYLNDYDQGYADGYDAAKRGD